MIDYDKPILNKDGKPLTILECAAHHCIRCVKKTRVLRNLGYVTHGMGNKPAYGTRDYDTYMMWHTEAQFKNAIKMYLNEGVDVIVWDNEPDHPAVWIKEVIDGANSDCKLITDCHDLDSVRRQFIPLPERKMFNAVDGVIYPSIPVQEVTNELHELTKPNMTIYSYCSKPLVSRNGKDIRGNVDWKWEDISKRRNAITYQGGLNPPGDQQMNQQFPYRDLHGIMKKLIDQGNEVHIFCGNASAYNTYQHIGAVLYPPTEYDEMMKRLTEFKYGILIFNNEQGTEHQVNLTLTNKMQEYLQAGVPSLACYCPESEKYVEKHGIGFTFKNLKEVQNTSQLEDKYMSVMETIKQKQDELLMDNFIWKLENLFAEVLGVEKKGIPDNIRKLSVFEYGEEETGRLL